MALTIKKILVPVDPTKVSVAAWNHAAELGARFGAQARGVFVQDLHAVEAEGFYSGRVANLLREASLKAIRQRLGRDAKIDYRFGDPATLIAREIRKRKPDLVVMGTHHRVGFDRFLMGSVSEEIVRRSQAPTLVLERKPKKVRRILAPLNFEAYARSALRFTLDFAEGVGAEVVPLHVIEGLERRTAARDAMRKFLGTLPPAAAGRLRPPVFRSGNAVDGILAAAASADMVALSAHRRFFLEDVVLGTTAERVLRHSPKPLLTVPAGATPKA